MNMKYLLITALAAASVASLNAQTAPLYKFDFNNNALGTTTESTGSSTVTADLFYHSETGNTANNLRGANGSGVSGQAGDYALDLTGATQMGGGSTNPGYGGVAHASSGSLDNAQSVTISGWYNASSSPTDYARMIEIGYSSIYFQPESGLRASFNISDAAKNDKFIDSASETIIQANTWVFFAVTYDGVTGEARVYAGTKEGGTLTQVAYDEIATGTISGSGLSIGNSANSNYERPFKGLIDDISVWADTEDSSGALSQSQLQNVMNASIPEPSQSAGLLAVIAGSALLYFRRRRG